MSATANAGVRCDWCGRISRHPLGEYARPHGSAGAIRPPEWAPGGAQDICDECAAGRCPGCGSTYTVTITPAVPGPYGWGGRCRDCGHTWTMPVIRSPQED